MKTDFPLLRKRKNGDVIRIEVMADSMRVGKTTAVKVLAEGLRADGYRVSESYEDWQSNPFLKNSYKDLEKNFLNSQKWFIKRKWEQIRDGGEADVFIQDVSPEMDYCYAETNRRLGRMNEKNFEIYDKYFRGLKWGLAQAPNLIVCLQVSDDELIRRAMDSRREFEDVDPSYFLMMKKVNREWLKVAEKHEQYQILAIDTDRLDFAHENEAKRDLIEKVRKSIDLF